MRQDLHAKTSRWLLLAGVVLLAGCGSSGGGSTRATSSSTPAAKSTTKADYVTPPAGPSVIAACKRGVQGASGLSASTKQELDGVCDKEVEGTPKEAVRVVKIVCGEVANALPHATEVAKAKAFARCEAKVAE
ncbi:MAG TPA: hypothetical protein VGG98_06270 [Solirubrobacteraceae bacterium]|jgi:hypothetical protein